MTDNKILKTLRIFRLIAAICSEVLIFVVFLPMFNVLETHKWMLVALILLFVIAIPMTLAESRKKETRSELIRHVNPNTYYSKCMIYAVFAFVTLVSAFVFREQILLLTLCFFFGVFNALDANILYRVRKSVS